MNDRYAFFYTDKENKHETSYLSDNLAATKETWRYLYWLVKNLPKDDEICFYEHVMSSDDFQDIFQAWLEKTCGCMDSNGKPNAAPPYGMACNIQAW